MKTDYNPTERGDNCGFCAISYGLYLQKPPVVDADKLYLAMIEYMGLAREGNQDPIPRMLIFPDLSLPQGIPPTAYSVLSGVLSLSSYTIIAVAEHFGLRFIYSRAAVALPNQFFTYQVEKGGRGSLNDFMKTRLEFLRAQGANPSADSVRKQVSNELVGDSIVGSQDARHFINLRIDPAGYITGYDAQDGNRYDARGLRSRIGSVALFMRLR